MEFGGVWLRPVRPGRTRRIILLYWKLVGGVCGVCGARAEYLRLSCPLLDLEAMPRHVYLGSRLLRLTNLMLEL